MIDVGAGSGALVVWAPAELADHELEIRALGTPWDGRHVAVRRRNLPGGPRWAAMFASLAHGRYELRLRHGAGPVVTVEVVGYVTEAQWPPSGQRAPGAQRSPGAQSASALHQMRAEAGSAR